MPGPILSVKVGIKVSAFLEVTNMSSEELLQTALPIQDFDPLQLHALRSHRSEINVQNQPSVDLMPEDLSLVLPESNPGIEP